MSLAKIIGRILGVVLGVLGLLPAGRGGAQEDGRASSPPSAADVARRVLALRAIIGYGKSLPPPDLIQGPMASWSREEKADFQKKMIEHRDSVWASFKEVGLWPFLSSEERKLAEVTGATVTMRQLIDVSWRMESADVLLWALGLVPSLGSYSEQASLDHLKLVSGISVSKFVESASLRTREEIEKARDLAELWHWRSRTRQLIEEGRPFEASPEMVERGLTSYDAIVRIAAKAAHEKGDIPSLIDEDFPAFGKAYRDLRPDEWSQIRSISMERHFALNWLCGYAEDNNWDETPTGT